MGRLHFDLALVSGQICGQTHRGLGLSDQTSANAWRQCKGSVCRGFAGQIIFNRTADIGKQQPASRVSGMPIGQSLDLGDPVRPILFGFGQSLVEQGISFIVAFAWKLGPAFELDVHVDRFGLGRTEFAQLDGSSRPFGNRNRAVGEAASGNIGANLALQFAHIAEALSGIGNLLAAVDGVKVASELSPALVRKGQVVAERPGIAITPAPTLFAIFEIGTVKHLDHRIARATVKFILPMRSRLAEGNRALALKRGGRCDFGEAFDVP